MKIAKVVPQLRTTDLDASIDFYVSRLGFELAFRHSDFYAGIRAGDQLFHLKLVDTPDPSIDFVESGNHLHLYFETADVDALASSLAEKGVPFVSPVQDTAWGTRELTIRDDQGHTLCFGQPR